MSRVTHLVVMVVVAVLPALGMDWLLLFADAAAAGVTTLDVDARSLLLLLLLVLPFVTDVTAVRYNRLLFGVDVVMLLECVPFNAL